MRGGFMKCSKFSHVGLVRRENEDNFLVAEDLGLAVVADGMGGHRAGETASRLAVTEIEACLRKMKDWLRLDPAAALDKAVQTANKKIWETARADESKRGMGTTVTAALVVGEKLYVAHIGDSRAYLCRDHKIYQLTKDHSLVNELLEAGGITAEEAENHPHRHILTRALGTREEVKADIGSWTYNAGDVLVLCTDGLFNLVKEDEILQVVEESSLAEAAPRLGELALQRGGYDNVTVLVCSL